VASTMGPGVKTDPSYSHQDDSQQARAS
jgi:hypothetical protein